MIVSGYRRNKSGVGEADLRVGGGMGIEADARTIELYSRAIGTGGVYALNMVSREDNLLRNPDSRRYGEMYDGQSINSQSISPYIGYKADPYEKEFIAEIPRLDEIGGLSGYTYTYGGNRFNEYQKNRFNDVIGNVMKYIASYTDDLSEGEPYLYEKKDDPGYVNNVASTPQHRTESNKKIISLGPNFEPEIIQKIGQPLEDPNKVSYLLYDENPNVSVHEQSRGNMYESINRNYGESAWEKGSSLIKKTNQLFREGKINSMVSRFVVKDGTEDISRGRKLKASIEKPIVGFDNPYCRVWTSHHQYSKIKNAMVPQRRERDTVGEQYTLSDMHKLLGQDMRPNRAPDRLAKFTTRNALGIIKVAPKRGYDPSEEIKKCMFSIENLAWKDIMFGAKVDGMLTTITKSQTGPNGGRIMWFPPYNLRFTEQVSTKWDQNEFIGRGEKIHTYVNTERRGTLDFTILVDHPSRIGKWAFENGELDSNDRDNVEKMLRYLAGIDIPEFPSYVNEASPVPEKFKGSDDPNLTEDEYIYKTFVFFFPNNYTGHDDKDNADFLEKMYSGETAYETRNDGKGIDIGENIPAIDESGKQRVDDNGKKIWWRYWIDKKYQTEKLLKDYNYTDMSGFSLNRTVTYYNGDNKTPENYSETGKKIVEQLGIRDIRGIFGIDEFITFMTQSGGSDGESMLYQDILNSGKYEIRFLIEGMASQPGKNNDTLAKNRANRIEQLIIDYAGSGVRTGDYKPKPYEDIKKTASNEDNVPPIDDRENISTIGSKIARSAILRVAVKSKSSDPSLAPSASQSQSASTGGAGVVEKKTTFVRQLGPEGRMSRNITEIDTTTQDQKNVDWNNNNYIYENEYLYFNEIYEDNEIVKKNLVEKVKYFHPAFHSITPEGFNARLTFLQQCMRQGPTVSAADKHGNPHWAGNLSFGRAPYCVLRIGDFYNTKICIDSLNITYEGDGSIPWDLNQDGIGVQPMLANVTMSFTFIGGQDLSGPIARLQNAVSYNYYANTSVYDRHSDFRDGYISKENDWAWIWNPVMNGESRDNSVHEAWGTVGSRPENMSAFSITQKDYRTENEDLLSSVDQSKLSAGGQALYNPINDLNTQGGTVQARINSNIGHIDANGNVVRYVSKETPDSVKEKKDNEIDPLLRSTIDNLDDYIKKWLGRE